MDIKFNPGNMAGAGVNSQPVTNTTPAAPASASRAEVSLDSANALEQALQNVPEVRPEKVAQARQLVADAKYPSDQVMGGIAQLLSQHIQNN